MPSKYRVSLISPNSLIKGYSSSFAQLSVNLPLGLISPKRTLTNIEEVTTPN